VESGATGRARLVWAAVLLAVGASLAVTTLFMANGPLLSSTAGPGGVAVAVGLALLAPRLVTVYGALFPARLGATVRLAVRNLRARARHTAAVVAPLVLLVGIAAGTLSMQRAEDSVPHGADDAGAKLASVNYLVVAMITAFAAIVVVTTLVAATRRRTREFGLLRLAAITDRQTLKLVTVEASLTTGLAVLLGGVAATATTVPYSLVRTGSPLAAGSVWMFLAVVGGALLLSLGAAVPTAARALRTRPIDAVAGGSRGAA
ncbi:FtsX-like permease family protein, partial [Actinoallomurus acaciae]